MVTANEIFNEARRLIHSELTAIADYRRTRSSESSWAIVGSRTDLLPWLQEAARLQDIRLLLDIERTCMELELNRIAYDPDNINSPRIGIRQVDAAAIMLDCVRDSVEYRRVHFYYNL